MPREQPQPTRQKPEDVINIVYGLATIYNGAFTPVLRSRFGSHAFASYPATLILLLVCAASCPELAKYIPVWLALVLFRRLTADRTLHSRYQGYPWLCRLIPFVNTEFRARAVEPWLCFFGGIFLMQVSEPLARFVMGGSLSLFIVLMTETVTLEKRKRAMHDAAVEAGRMMDLQRGGNGWD